MYPSSCPILLLQAYYPHWLASGLVWYVPGCIWYELHLFKQNCILGVQDYKCHTHFIKNRQFWVSLRWCPVTDNYVGKLTVIGSDNGLLPGRRQAIIWTRAGIFLVGPLRTNCNNILIGIHIFSLTKIRFRMPSAKYCPFPLGLNGFNSLFLQRVMHRLILKNMVPFLLRHKYSAIAIQSMLCRCTCLSVFDFL